MTRQQKWAKKALELVLKEAVKDPGTRSKFRTHCFHGPNLLQQAGAAQAVGFWNRNDDGKNYLNALAQVWAAGAGQEAQKATREALVNSVIDEASLQNYMALTRDLIAAATWLRRFAQAELPNEDDRQEDAHG
jgi:CRISPR-associated protein Cmr5